MRIALYARVSTTHQAQAQTIEQQLTRLRSFAEQYSWILTEQHIYRDDGSSRALTHLSCFGLAPHDRQRIESGRSTEVAQEPVSLTPRAIY